jgi:glutamine synthetase
LEQALGELDKDRDFLKQGGVFSDDAIDAYLGLKMEELDEYRMSTHPVEFKLYYSV